MLVGHPKSNSYTPYDFDAGNKHYVENVFDKSFTTVGTHSRCGIITCCDARCIPENFYGLKENEAFVIRTGGGRSASEDVIRTLTLIQVLSEVKELRVVHQTGKPLEKLSINAQYWGKAHGSGPSFHTSSKAFYS